MKSDLNTRAEHEVSHGRWLAEQDTEKVWGWNTPAGTVSRPATRTENY